MIEIGIAHAAVLAAIHGDAFPPGERWGAPAFASLLATPGAFGLLHEGGGFILLRQAGGEAEVLTIAVAPAFRRRGFARALLMAAVARVDGPVFLEVAADNAAALGLYRNSGFILCGQRRDYYGLGCDALVLRRDATVA